MWHVAQCSLHARKGLGLHVINTSTLHQLDATPVITLAVTTQHPDSVPWLWPLISLTAGLATLTCKEVTAAWESNTSHAAAPLMKIIIQSDSASLLHVVPGFHGYALDYTWPPLHEALWRFYRLIQDHKVWRGSLSRPIDSPPPPRTPTPSDVGTSAVRLGGTDQASKAQVQTQPQPCNSWKHKPIQWALFMGTFQGFCSRQDSQSCVFESRCLTCQHWTICLHCKDPPKSDGLYFSQGPKTDVIQSLSTRLLSYHITTDDKSPAQHH